MSTPHISTRLDVPPPESSDVMEISLLLPSWQVAALTAAAGQWGMTTGQLVRRLFSDFFARQQAAEAEKLDVTAQW